MRNKNRLNPNLVARAQLVRRLLFFLFVLGTLALIISILASPAAAQNQQTGQAGRSAIVKITDPEKEFYKHSDRIRAAFNAAGLTAAEWKQAEEAMRAYLADSENSKLHLQMLEARSDLIAKILEKLRDATKESKGFETAYKNNVKHLNGQITDAVAGLAETQVAATENANYLKKCLQQLDVIDSEMPNIERLVDTESGKLTDEEVMIMTEFQAQIEASKQELENLKDSQNLHERNIAILGAIKIEAAKEFLRLKKVVCRARHDQVSLVGRLRNDLTSIQQQENEERLRALLKRKDPDYVNPNRRIPSGGYRNSELPNVDDSEFRIDKLVDKKLRDEIRQLVDDQSQTSRPPVVAQQTSTETTQSSVPIKEPKQ